MTEERVAVILASTGATCPTDSRLSGFTEEVSGRGEILVVDPKPGRTLVPEMWAAGLDITDAPLVVFSTTRMSPEPGWLDALIDRMEKTGAAAVGGPILEASGINPLDRAVYLQRFVNYRTPWPTGQVIQPPGENALYRRECLLGLESCWASGFWEVEIQRRLLERGEALAMAEGAVVRFQGGARFTETLTQRFQHARRYGAARSRGLSFPDRFLRACRAPMVPPVLLARGLGALRARGVAIGPRVASLPPLAMILSAWAAGEALGTLSGHQTPASHQEITTVDFSHRGMSSRSPTILEETQAS